MVEGLIQKAKHIFWDANIYLLLFLGIKRKKEQADIKKEQVVCEMNQMGKIEER